MQQGLVHADDIPYPSITWIEAIAEKRAYASAHQIFTNLGRNAVAGSMSALVAPYKDLFASRADVLRDDMLRLDTAANPDNPRVLAGLALTVMAVTQLFGDAKEPCTYRELQALTSLGLVHLPERE